MINYHDLYKCSFTFTLSAWKFPNGFCGSKDLHYCHYENYKLFEAVFKQLKEALNSRCYNNPNGTLIIDISLPEWHRITAGSRLDYEDIWTYDLVYMTIYTSDNLDESGFKELLQQKIVPIFQNMNFQACTEELINSPYIFDVEKFIRNFESFCHIYNKHTSLLGGLEKNTPSTSAETDPDDFFAYNQRLSR